MNIAKQGVAEPFAALNKIPIVENNEPLVDLRHACPRLNLRTGLLCYVREHVAQMLLAAQETLPPGHKISVHSALRTMEMQSEMYWRNFNKLQEQHPSWPRSALRRACNKYFAAPDVKAPPGHCTGGAVDVSILGPDGHTLDMTSPTVGWQAAYTYASGLSPAAAANRKMLIDAMFAAGFSNCRDEWWHWSYGDNAWAVRLGRPKACYGLITPPENFTRVSPARPERVLVRRKNHIVRGRH